MCHHARPCLPTFRGLSDGPCFLFEFLLFLKFFFFHLRFAFLAFPTPKVLYFPSQKKTKQQPNKKLLTNWFTQVVFTQYCNSAKRLYLVIGILCITASLCNHASLCIFTPLLLRVSLQCATLLCCHISREPLRMCQCLQLHF